MRTMKANNNNNNIKRTKHQKRRHHVVLCLRIILLVMSIYIIISYSIQYYMIHNISSSLYHLQQKQSFPWIIWHQQKQYQLDRSNIKSRLHIPIKKRKEILSSQRLTQPDGTINTIPFYNYNNNNHIPPISQIDCINHNNHNNINDNNNVSWMKISCRYINLCYDIQQQDYVRFINFDHDHDNDNIYNPYVSLGGINPRWFNNNDSNNNEQLNALRWKPRIIHVNGSTGSSNNTMASYYYMISNHVAYIPFHSMAGHNVGHLLWDDFYSIYTLLKLFSDPYIVSQSIPISTTKQQQQLQKQLLLIRHKVLYNNQQNESIPLYASCDIRRIKRMGCKDFFLKFLPLLGIDPNTFSVMNQIQIEFTNTNAIAQQQQQYICFPKSYAGIGLLTDHGKYDHGWDTINNISTTSSKTTATSHYSDTNTLRKERQNEELSILNDNHVNQIPHNLGRGIQFHNFRNFLLHNHDIITMNNNQSTTSELQVEEEKKSSLCHIYITFSIQSSRDWSRRLNFTEQITLLKEYYNNDNNPIHSTCHVHINVYKFYELTLNEQMNIIQNYTNILITVNGGGSINSMFLLRNSVVFMYYDAYGGYNSNTMISNYQPIQLDYDLLSNIPYIRIHWIPITFINYRLYHIMNNNSTNNNNNRFDNDYEKQSKEELDLFLYLIQHEISIIIKTHKTTSTKKQ